MQGNKNIHVIFYKTTEVLDQYRKKEMKDRDSVPHVH